MVKRIWSETTFALFVPLPDLCVTHFGLSLRGKVSVITRYGVSVVGISFLELCSISKIWDFIDPFAISDGCSTVDWISGWDWMGLDYWVRNRAL